MAWNSKPPTGNSGTQRFGAEPDIPVDAAGHFDEKRVLGSPAYTGKICLFFQQADRRAGVAVVQAKDKVWRPLPPATISLKVTDSKGNPILGVAVNAVAIKVDNFPSPIQIPPTIGRTMARYTDADGNCTVAGLSLRTKVLLNIQASGYAFTPQNYVTPTRDPSLTKVVLRHGGTIEGTVVDGSGRQLPRMNVQAIQPGHKTGLIEQTDPSGHFRLGGLAPGAYDVQLYARTPNDAWMKKVKKHVVLPEGGQIRVSLIASGHP